MADDDPGLHDAWATPPDPPPAPPEIDFPTSATPVPRRRWPGSAKATVAVLVVLLLGTAAILGYGWWKTSDDKKDLESASNQQGQELSQQLDTSKQDTAAAQKELTAANAKVTDLQDQLTTAQTEAAAAKEQNDALEGLFPLNAAKVQPGLPGTYRSDPAQVQACSLSSCPTAQLTLTVASGGALTVSDPNLGQVPLTPAGAGWTATGPASAALQLSCSGVAQATTYVLTLAPAAIALDSKQAPQVTTLQGGLVLSSPLVPPSDANNLGCPAGVASYVITANRT